MFSKQIAETIHFFIRKNNLKNIIRELLKSKKSNSLSKISQRLYEVLDSKDEIYTWKEAKYINFLKNIDNYGDNSKKFELYSIPKKNSNLFLVFLIYYFLNNNKKLTEKTIFDTIYTYYLIIIYRNRLDYVNRKKILDINKKEFLDINYDNFFPRSFKFILPISGFLIFTSLLFLDIRFLKTNVLLDGFSGFGNILYTSLLVDDIDSLSSTLRISNLSSLNLLNILLIFFAVSLVGYLKEVFRSTFLQNLFSFFVKIFVSLYNILSYPIILINNFLIFFLFNIFNIIKYNFLALYLTMFIFTYFFIYVFIILSYIMIFGYLLNINSDYMYVYSLLISIILIYSNLNNGLRNFESFLISADNLLEEEKN